MHRNNTVIEIDLWNGKHREGDEEACALRRADLQHVASTEIMDADDASDRLSAFILNLKTYEVRVIKFFLVQIVRQRGAFYEQPFAIQRFRRIPVLNLLEADHDDCFRRAHTANREGSPILGR